MYIKILKRKMEKTKQPLVARGKTKFPSFQNFLSPNVEMQFFIKASRGFTKTFFRIVFDELCGTLEDIFHTF